MTEHGDSAASGREVAGSPAPPPPSAAPPPPSPTAAPPPSPTAAPPEPSGPVLGIAAASTWRAFEPAMPAAVFTPLRSDPPPTLFATWWLRYLLFLSQIVGVIVVLLHEYSAPGEMASMIIVVPHVMAAVMLVGWSALAMLDAARLTPPARYARPPRARVAVVLWLLAFASPFAAVFTLQRAQVRFTEGDDLGVVVATTAVLVVCFLLVWLPFRYHTRQALRIGAPTRVVGAWFWLPLISLVGALVINGLGLHELLAENGITAAERAVQSGVIYGVPAVMFALSTWRATTVFDEVIDLRWNRWRSDWEQTLAAMSAQPPPGPEASPVIVRR